MTGAEPGINDWFLNREGRWDVSADDEPVEHGLDNLPYESSVSVRGRRPEQRRPARHRTPTDTSNVVAKPQITGASALDRKLAREAVAMNEQARFTLSFADVAAKMRAKGRKVTRAGLSRAMKVTGTRWGPPPKLSQKATPRSRPAVIVPASTPRSSQPRETRINPTRTLGVGPLTTGWAAYRASTTSSAGKDAQLKPMPDDAALSRAALRINRAASRTLSYKTVASVLRSDGWDVCRADIARAIESSGAQWANPSKSRNAGKTRKSVGAASPVARRPRAASVPICESCGVRLSPDGHCGCS